MTRMTDVTVDDRLDGVLRGLADRVRALRRARDFSVAGLAFEAGISESRVRAIESGRATASLATLVALAETFEIEIAELFGGVVRTAPGDEATRSEYVVPSEVVWGGDLPPAPWMSAPAAKVSPYVVPSEVVWGGELPTAPWSSAVAAPTMPEPALAPVRPESTVYPPTEQTWGGPLPPAPWVRHEAPIRPPEAAWSVMHAPAPIETASRPAPPATGVVASRPQPVVGSVMTGVERAPAPRRQLRTFTELREGVLADREFRSLREFAVAAVVEARHPVSVVARVFRLPSWRLERWIAETGASPR